MDKMKELESYLLVYAAKADFIIQEEEKKVILTKISKDDYNAAKALYKSHNDIESINYITELANELNLTEKDKTEMLNSIMHVFMADDEFDAREQQVNLFIQKIL